ncbi:MAG TPA: CIA30 family protein [Polyangia bacterium]|nr:CIA30 family protein [Polyangia bacterium]
MNKLRFRYSTTTAILATLVTGALFGACSGGGGGGSESGGSDQVTAAAAVAGSSIDDFNETNTSAWVPFADKSSTISTVRAADHADSTGASLQIDYNVASGGYAGIERGFQPAVDWSSITAMNLWINGRATGHSFLVQLYDAGQERWEAHFTVDFNGWQQVTIPFSSFKAAAWQAPEAKANGVLDLNGVTGVALVPSEGSGAGTVGVDALQLGAGAAATSATTATPASTSMPAPVPTPTAAPSASTPTASTPTASTPTASTPTAAAPTAATSTTPTSSTAAPTTTTTTTTTKSSATTSTAAPAATSAPASSGMVGATGVNGTIIPLYTSPTDPSWDAVVAAKQAHPTVPVVAIVNPSNGPGSAEQPSYTSGVAKLTAAGVKVIGYVHTSYGARGAADVQADMNNWHGWYPGVTGIFFDEMANGTGYESYYSSLTAYAKGHGFNFTVGNPGSDSSAGYVGTVDVILVYESGGLPAASAVTSWHSSYPRQNFGVIPYRVSAVDTAFIAATRPYIGYIYLQSDDLPNPWDSVPSYLSSLLGALQ